VLVVDDDVDMRALITLRIGLEGEPLEVAGHAGGGWEAINRCRELHPDVVVLDQRMPDLTGLETAAVLHFEDPELPIIIFSAYLDEPTIAAAKRVGLRFVSKTDLPGLIDVLKAE
jgi:DNA-binding NarL/FixJ family response regulator